MLHQFCLPFADHKRCNLVDGHIRKNGQEPVLDDVFTGILRRRLQAPFVVAEIMLAEMLEGNQTALGQLVEEIPFVLFGFLGTGKAAF